MGRMPFLSSNQQCQGTKEKACTDPNQWPGLILFTSTIGLLSERELVALHRLSDASTSAHNICKVKSTNPI